MGVVRVIVILLRAFFFRRAALADEILALLHQLGVFQLSVRRPRLRQRDRIFSVWLSRLWSDWPESLVIVKPETPVSAGTARAAGRIGGGSRGKKPDRQKIHEVQPAGT